MSQKLFLLVSFALFFIITEIKSRDNIGRKLSCWPFALKYETFAINITLSRRNMSDEILIPGVSFSPKAINFDPRRKTIMLVHGFAISKEHRAEMRNLRDHLLELSDVNVLFVNWEPGCSNVLLYFQAVVNTEYVALTVKDFLNGTIKLWRKEYGYKDDWTPELHFVGFSLGAHVCGQVAEILRVEDNFLVDRITGLDPAGPCFEHANFTLRLANTNAVFVDVIHTDASVNEDESFGLIDPIGHVDFYVNGGRHQPGCKSILRRKRSVANLLKLLAHAIENGACSHARALFVFSESVKQSLINNCYFSAYPWEINTEFNRTIEDVYVNPPEMGINADIFYYNASTYYVPTLGNEPYCYSV